MGKRNLKHNKKEKLFFRCKIFLVGLEKKKSKIVLKASIVR